MYNLFSYSFMSPKMRNKHAFSPGVLDMYEIMSYFITQSYLNLKTHNIFLKRCFMTNNLKIIQI